MKKPRTYRRPILLLWLSAVVSAARLSKAAPGDLDPSFNAASGINGPVCCVVVQPDGKPIIGGGFTTVRDAPRKALARLNTDGTADVTFTPDSAVQDVSTLLREPDGKLLFGSDFVKVIGSNGYLRTRLSRLNPDGSLDNTFDASASADSGYSVTSMLECPGGKLLLQIFSDKGTRSLVRLNANGSIDGGFVLSSDLQTNAINAVAVQPDGKLYIAGDFTAVQGFDRNGLARLQTDGSLDSAFDPGQGLGPASVETIALDSSGRILIGGRFSRVNGTARQKIARLQPSGALDNTFDSHLTAQSEVSYLTFEPDGKPLLSGSVGTNRSSITVFARLNADGTWDNTFKIDPEAIRVSGGYLSSPKTFAVRSDGKIFAGAVLLNNNGSIDPGFDPRPLLAEEGDSAVWTMALEPDGKVLIGGDFSVIQRQPRGGLARLNPDGTLDPAFQPKLLHPHSVFSAVRRFVLQPDGKILIVGNFESINGAPATNSARLNRDGTLDSSFIPAKQGNLMILQSDGKIVLTDGTGIFRLNTDGSLDSAFAAATAFAADWAIGSLAQEADGKLLLGGFLGNADENVSGQCDVARLNADGTLNSRFSIIPETAPAQDTYPSITSITVQPDRKVLLGGFLDFGTDYPAFLVRMQPDGNLDSGFQAAHGREVVLLQSDGRILLGARGDYGGGPDNQVERLNSDGTLDPTFKPAIADSPSYSQSITTMLQQPDGNILLGGSFSMINDETRVLVARLLGGPLSRLELTSENGLMTLSWPSAFSNYFLESSSALIPANWQVVPIRTNRFQLQSQFPRQFYRLHTP